MSDAGRYNETLLHVDEELARMLFEKNGNANVAEGAPKLGDELAKKISEEAGKRYPAYNRLVDELGIAGNTTAMEALAEILTYIDPSEGFRKTASLLGLFKPVRGRQKIYDGRLRQALQRLTSSVNNIPIPQLKAKTEKETLARIWKTYRQETERRPVIPAQG